MKFDKLIAELGDDLVGTLMEAVWTMRESDNGDSVAAVLTTEEATQICSDIVKELNKAGYRIVKE